MRLSEWRATAPSAEAVSAKVAAVVDPILIALSAGPDPHCWVAWGEEPASRFTIFAITDPGLVVCFARVNVPGEGPRATAKLIRWSRVSIGELAVETQAGHRMLSFQLESQVLRGVDEEADRVAAFAIGVIAAIDGRPPPPGDDDRSDRGRGTSAAGARAAGGAGGRTSGSPRSGGGKPGAPADPAAPRTGRGAAPDRHR